MTIKTLGVPCMELSIRPRFESELKLSTTAVVLEKLPVISSGKATDVQNFEHLRNLKYADPSFNSSGDIDIILGVIEHGKIIKPGLIKGDEDAPITQNSELGWIVSGQCNAHGSLKVVSLVTNIWK